MISRICKVEEWLHLVLGHPSWISWTVPKCWAFPWIVGFVKLACWQCCGGWIFHCFFYRRSSVFLIGLSKPHTCIDALLLFWGRVLVLFLRLSNKCRGKGIQPIACIFALNRLQSLLVVNVGFHIQNALVFYSLSHDFCFVASEGPSFWVLVCHFKRPSS